jgi:hypothetical protein
MLVGLGIGVVVVILVIATLSDGNGSGGQSNPPASKPEAPAPKSGFDKANYPSYDGADLSGYARFLAEEDSANCTQTFVSRVRRFAADTFAYQPLVYPEDTNEFIGYLRRHCAAEGAPIP